VKWQNFKVAYVRHRYSDEAPQVMATPVVTNLLTDPKERESWPVTQAYNWVHAHAQRLRKAYERSILREPLIPAGAPIDYVPKRRPKGG
jgi:arylsulfatase